MCLDIGFTYFKCVMGVVALYVLKQVYLAFRAFKAEKFYHRFAKPVLDLAYRLVMVNTGVATGVLTISMIFNIFNMVYHALTTVLALLFTELILIFIASDRIERVEEKASELFRKTLNSI